MSIVFSLGNSIIYGENLPEPIQKLVFRSSSFTTISIFLPRDDKANEQFVLQCLNEGSIPAFVRTTAERWIEDRNFLNFLIHNGFATAVRSKYQRYSSMLGREEELTYDWVFYSDNIKPYTNEATREYLFGQIEKGFSLTLARRKLQSIANIKHYEEKDEFGFKREVFSFSFIYTLDEVFPNLPDIKKEYRGKAEVYLDTAGDKKWKLRLLDLEDNKASEYIPLLDKQFGKEEIRFKETATPQLPTQAPIIPETPEKITIDSLTKNLPYGEYNAGRFQAREKTYNVTFDDAWAAVNKVLPEHGEKIVTSDRNKGVLIGQGKSTIYDHFWTAAIIEKITEYSVKITIKNIAYRGDTVDSYSYITHKNIEKELKSKVKQPPYFVTIEAKEYKVSGDIFTGKKEGRVFKDEKGTVVRDLALAKKIAQAAWVYENVVKAPGLPGSKRVSAILETHKRLRQYELAQGILARASVQILAATISGGTSLTYTVPAGLTWRVVREQFLNLKGLLSLTGRQGLEEALSKYQQIESSIANLKPNSIDDVTATEIRRLYEPAHGLELSCGALLTSLMPKKGRQLLEKALKDMGDELVRTLPLSDAAISDAVLTNRELFDLQGKMEDALKTDPALKEYYEKLNLAKRLTEANEQVITTWAEQAVGDKE